MSILPVAPIGNVALGAAAPAAPSLASSASSFSRMLLDGIGQVDTKVANADAIVRRFALDDSVPLHQVTFALEQSRMSVELMMQVRSRLVEGLQRVMDMQL